MFLGFCSVILSDLLSLADLKLEVSVGLNLRSVLYYSTGFFTVDRLVIKVNNCSGPTILDLCSPGPSLWAFAGFRS